MKRTVIDHDRDRTTVLVIGGMHCAACVNRVEQALRSRSGVETAGVNLLTRLATVRHTSVIHPKDLAEAVAAAGYQATLANPGPEGRGYVSFGDTIDLIASRKSRFIAGAGFTLMILLINHFWANEDKLLFLFLLATPVQITVGWDYYRGCIRALRRWRLTLDSLVVLGSTAAFLQGFLCFIGYESHDMEMAHDPQFHAAALILTVMTLGKWLEARARESTNQLWGSLIEITPKEACVIRDGREQVIPAGVVAMGDTVLVRPHQKFPVDGEIIEGNTEVNESLITGESRPVPKVAGDRVIVASVNGSGFVRVRAQGVGADSTIGQIARMVTDAQERKARVEQVADRVSAFMVPLSIAIGAAAFVLWYFGPYAAQGMIAHGWLPKDIFNNHSWLKFLSVDHSLATSLRPAIAVLIAACPSALGLATPMVVIQASRAGVRRGILLKGGDSLESAARITDVVFDKTGTLTDGSFTAHEVLAMPGVDRDELLTAAASLEACSEHALARGVLKEAKKGSLQLLKVENIELLPGRGLRGTVKGKNYLLGSRTLISERGFKLSGDFATRATDAESAGLTLVFLAELNSEGGSVLGAIALADEVKESSAPAIADLHKQGLRAHLLSGDNPAAAQAVGRICGLQDNQIHALMKPEDKVDFIRQLKSEGRSIAALGDGINDAPALAAADVGIAMGTGTDIAIDSGQIVIASSDVRRVPQALRLSRMATRLVRWNIFWAFLLNLLLLLPLAILNSGPETEDAFRQMTRLNVSLGAAVLAVSSLIVTVNSLRLVYMNFD